MKSAGIVVALFLGVGLVHAQNDDEAQERAEAAKKAPALSEAMKEATVSLVGALKTSESQGRPISGKFEIEAGKLQLSIYTMKDGKFFEVIVDHKTGKIAKTEVITEKEDLEEAKEQAEAMAKTKRSLSDFVAQVEKANAGYKAVEVTPEIEGGAVRAEVELLKGSESKQVEEKL